MKQDQTQTQIQTQIQTQRVLQKLPQTDDRNRPGGLSLHSQQALTSSGNSILKKSASLKPQNPGLASNLTNPCKPSSTRPSTRRRQARNGKITSSSQIQPLG